MASSVCMVNEIGFDTPPAPTYAPSCPVESCQMTQIQVPTVGSHEYTHPLLELPPISRERDVEEWLSSAYSQDTVWSYISRKRAFAAVGPPRGGGHGAVPPLPARSAVLAHRGIKGTFS